MVNIENDKINRLLYTGVAVDTFTVIYRWLLHTLVNKYEDVVLFSYDAMLTKHITLYSAMSVIPKSVLIFMFIPDTDASDLENGMTLELIVMPIHILFMF